MKKYLFVVFCTCAITWVKAQKIEITAQANAGLFNYSGPSAVSSSTINQSGDFSNYTNNPYSVKKTFSYGFAVQAQVVSKNGFIAGLQTGYDILRSKTDITGVYPYAIYFLSAANFTYNPAPVPATGTTYLQNKFINLNPYVGYRFHYHQIKVDVLPGADIGFNVNSYNSGKAIASNNVTYQTSMKEPNAPTDIRLKMGVAISYNRFGIKGSYAWGITNYEKNVTDVYDGKNDYDVKSRLLRLGISYRIF